MRPAVRRALFSGRWDPYQLGHNLLGWWSADRNDSILRTGGTPIVTWSDVTRNRYAATQGTSDNRPTYAPTSFNNCPAITFDGSNDELTLGSTPFPTGANPVEVWAVVEQSALAADSTTRMLFSYGGTGNANRRALLRRVSGGVNRFGADTGDNSSAIATDNAAVDFSGRHCVRAIFGATATSVSVNGGALSTTNVVPATGTTRTRIGANTANTAAVFWNGRIRHVVVANPLADIEAALMAAWGEAERAA